MEQHQFTIGKMGALAQPPGVAANRFQKSREGQLEEIVHNLRKELRALDQRLVSYAQRIEVLEGKKQAGETEGLVANISITDPQVTMSEITRLAGMEGSSCCKAPVVVDINNSNLRCLKCGDPCSVTIRSGVLAGQIRTNNRRRENGEAKIIEDKVLSALQSTYHIYDEISYSSDEMTLAKLRILASRIATKLNEK